MILFKEKKSYKPNSDYGKFMKNFTTYSFDYANKHDDAPDSMAMFTNEIILDKAKRLLNLYQQVVEHMAVILNIGMAISIKIFLMVFITILKDILSLKMIQMKKMELVVWYQLMRVQPFLDLLKMIKIMAFV